MTIFPFQAWYPDFDLIASADSFFNSVRDEYVAYKKADFFNQSKTPALFFYQIKSATRSYTGLMCCTDIAEFEKGNILKHEGTIAAKEQTMIQLLVQRKALVKPVLLVYKKVKAINRLIMEHVQNNPPLYSTYFEQDQQEHVLWKITDATIIEKVQKLFAKKVQATYIADGHHRTTTMALLKERLKDKPDKGQYNQLLVALFGSDQLDLLEYNRVVEGLNEISPTAFMAKLSRLFEIDPLHGAQKPLQKHQITLFINREWYLLTWKKSVLKEYKAQRIILDADLLNEKVLKNILNIKDVRFDNRIEYVSGTEGLRGLEQATIMGSNKIGFYLYPVQINELMQLAGQHQLLPPKSTYFEPRIKNGLVVKSLE
ncbi:MAG: DUF1015 family protein [Bacteroidota bacterium]